MKFTPLEAGIYSERRFVAFLNSFGIPFIKIYQDIESASHYHKMNKHDVYSVKRPDFVVGIESMGCIAIDVKNYRTYQDEDNPDAKYYKIATREITELCNFGIVYKLPVWLAFDTPGSSTVWNLYSLTQLQRTHWKEDPSDYKIYIKDCVDVVDEVSFKNLQQLSYSSCEQIDTGNWVSCI
jgi:hypothetical protein